MTFIPYSCQWIEDDDVAAVAETLRAPIISQGQHLVAFEAAFAEQAGTEEAIAFSSGTAALHAMYAVAGIGPGDEVIMPALTFASTANTVLHLGGTPVFADIDPRTRTLDSRAVLSCVTPQTKAIMAVDFAGIPSDYAALQATAEAKDLILLADAAHAVGASYRDQPVGSLAAMSAFSFGPVKNMTTGEGGMVTTNDAAQARLLRQFHNHGMTRDPDVLERVPPAGWYYEQQELGLNYKMTEFAAALGRSQLRKLARFNARRTEIAAFYNHALADLPLQRPCIPENTASAWHLYVVELLTESPYDRDRCFRFLRSQGVGVQVHYIPVPLHPYYQKRGYTLATCPNTEAYYRRALSLPLHPRMTQADAQRVVDTLIDFFE